MKLIGIMEHELTASSGCRMITATECDNPVKYTSTYPNILPATLWYISPVTRCDAAPNSTLPTGTPSAISCRISQAERPNKDNQEVLVLTIHSTKVRLSAISILQNTYSTSSHRRCRWTKSEMFAGRNSVILYRFYKHYGIPISLHKLLPFRVMRICATQHPHTVSAPFTGPPHTLFICMILLLGSRLYNHVQKWPPLRGKSVRDPTGSWKPKYDETVRLFWNI